MATVVEWTVLEKLLLSQAVYKYGEDNWFQIARNLKHHALLDRPSDYFNQKNCSLQYYLMVEDVDKQKRQSLTQDMPVVVQLARELYSLRLEELKKAIAKDEEKFLILVSEIDDIRAGKWDNQLLGLPEPLTPNLDISAIYDTSLSNTPAESFEFNPSPNNDENTISIKEEEAGLPTKDQLEKNAEEMIMNEEERKIEADNLENEARNIKQDDTLAIFEEIVQSAALIDTSHVTEQELVIPSISITSSFEQPKELEISTKEPMEEQSHPFKRQTSDTNILEEPLLKRHKIEQQSITDVISSENMERTLGKEVEERQPLAIDTSRTDYSTDVSQAATPADTSDAILREGTESVAGSESNAATPTSERKRGGGGNSMFANKDDQRHKSWLKNINLLWREIANHKNGAMFMNPIKETIAPHYYDIVKRPLDLKTIKNRIRDGLINTTTEFERDVILMLNNSLMYNKEGTEVYQMAREMLDDAQEQIKIFKTADTDTSASSHTRAASMAAKERRKSVINE